MSRKLDVITLENLHTGIMDVKNCEKDILQKLNMLQQRVHALEMENSILKHENKNFSAFWINSIIKQMNWINAVGKKTFVFMECPITSQVRKMMEKESFWK